MPRGVPGKPTCGEPECSREHYARGRCNMHHRRLLRHGTTQPTRPPAHQPLKTRDGYILIWAPDHPAAYRPSNRIPEHRLVMERTLGRRLLPGENVHHINGVRHDNRPENLELWITHQPKGQRAADAVAWAKEILERYEET